ncbi:transposase, partial [Salmonella enterica]
VKIKLSETTTEVLFTNLSKEEFSADDLKRLYHMRWGIETAFDQLKYALGAASVHSKNSELIIQELYGKLIMFNFCKTIV